MRSLVVPSFVLFATLDATACGSTATADDAGDARASDAAGAADAIVTPGSDASTADAIASNTTCTAVAHTCAEVQAAFALSSAGVTVTCDETAGTFTFHSTGVPNYTSTQRTPNAIEDQGWIVQLPLRPTCATATTDVVNSRGEIGFMVNGVPFYGPQDMNGNDAVQVEGASFDDCEGHADQGCSYHYHEEPTCVFGVHDTAAAHRGADGHPAIIGYALDGFAIYASDSAAGALDSCNGHSDATRGYHYHATSHSPYLVGCYRGPQSGVVMRTMNLCNMTGQPTDAGTTTPADAATMTGPRACTQTSECTNACPMGSSGCACQMTMTGMGCVPTCSASNTTCPNAGGMQLTCNTAMGVCVPMR